MVALGAQATSEAAATPPAAAAFPPGSRETVLYETDRTRVCRVTVPGRGGAGPVTLICKEALGPGSVARARHEAGILRRLAGVVGVPRLTEATGAATVVTEDDAGVPLAEAIAAGSVAPSAVPAIGLRLALAVAGVHGRGVVHKDINPANLLLTEAGRGLVLLDYDLASTFAEDRPGFAHHRAVVGTLPYVPPEQTGRTGRPVDQRADLYAVGAVLFELVAGRPPFEGDDGLRLMHDILVAVPRLPEQLPPGLPPALADVIERLLAKEPDLRYQSAVGLARDLSALVERPGRPLRLGGWDFPARLSAPSTLVGRDAEIAVLREAFGRPGGPARCVLLTGAPGVGKSALVNELRPVVAERGGWFVAGKSDQYRPDAAGGAVLAAVRGIARLLLAEPEAEVVATRTRLAGVLGAGAWLLAAAVPELAALLGPAAGPAATAEPGGAIVEIDGEVEVEPRLRQAVVELLRVVVSPRRPVVLFVDDLQWATPGGLGLLDAVLTAPDLAGLLVVAAWRSGEVTPAHPLAALLARWERLGVAGPPLRLANLPPAQLAGLLAGMLRLPAGRAAQLARSVGRWTDGNPYDTVELVNALRRDGLLTLGEHGWHWDDTAIRGYVARGDVIDLLRQRLAELPGPARELVWLLACLGGQVRMDLLAAAAGSAVPMVREQLAAALEDGLLILDGDGSRAGDPAADEVRFRHDRVQQAAYADPNPARRVGLRLAVARRLAGRPEYGAEAAGQYLAAAMVPGAPAPALDAAERRRVAGLYRAVAGAARGTGDYPAAYRFLAAATELWSGLGVAADDPALLDTQIDLHAALYSLGRLAEADQAFAAVRRRGPDPIAWARAVCTQLSSLSQRNRHRDAVALGLAATARLGVPGPRTGGPRARAGGLPGRLRELRDWVDGLDLAADLARPQVDDPRLLAVESLLGRLVQSAFFVDDLELLAWIVLISRRMWAEYGPSAGLAANLSVLALVAVPVLGDYRLGYVAGRHVLAVAEARGYEPQTSVLRHRHALHAMPFNERLENSIGEARLALEGLLRGGHLQTACNTGNTVLAAELDTGRSVETYAAAAETALALATRVGNRQIGQNMLAHRHLAALLTGSDDDHRHPHPAGGEDRHLAEVAGNPLATALLHICRAVAAVIFDDDAGLDRHSRAAAALRHLVPGYPVALVHLLRALSAARELRGAQSGTGPAARLRAELAECRAWLAARAADAPANFAHLVSLVDAERSWAEGDFAAAIAAFDAAGRAPAIVARRWHRALVAERTGRLLLEYGLTGLGRDALRGAREHYRHWGATAKVRELDGSFPFLRASAWRRAGPGTGGGGWRRTETVSAETIDVLTILRASQILSSQTDLAGLHAAIVEQLTVLTGATDVLLVLHRDDTAEWFLPAPPGDARTGDARTGDDGIGDDGTGDDGTGGSVEQAGRRGILPISAFRYAERTREPLLVDDATRDDRFARDPYLAGLDRCSLLLVPIRTQGETQAVLVLSNQDSAGAFTAERLDAVTLIAGQLAVSLRNAMLYASLEQRVADRTEALAAANRKLAVLSGTDALTQLANRRRFDEVFQAEWRRAARTGAPIGVVMIDVDFFKRYNDHYGHPAGDECLRRVAAVLQASTRSATDLACRYGGEEFVILLPGTTGGTTADGTGGGAAGGDAAADARAVAERARAAVAALRLPHAVSETGLVTISIGTAWTVPYAVAGPEELITRADAALYRAKAEGRNRVCAAS